MKAHTAVHLVDTNIIPDRNAGIGSLLRDLQESRAPDRDGPPLLGPEFAFIDVGVSRARVATVLKNLLVGDLGMAVSYVATERFEAVPYANVTLLGERSERIRGRLSRMISSGEAPREVEQWHYVVDHKGKVSSVAYSYRHHGNEVWEAYFMGRPFLVSGEEVAFLDPTLEELLVPDVPRIEAGIDLERKRASDPSQPGRSWDGYRMERDPLQAVLAEFGITLQKTDVPRRIEGRQNVLFLGNVLNNYPQDAQAPELDRITAGLEEGDVVIVQVDEPDTSSVEVLRVGAQGARKTRERVRWIDTRELEAFELAHGLGPWRRTCLKPVLGRMVSRLRDCLGRKASSPEWSREEHQLLVRRCIGHVFGTWFRALPVEETFRVAAREALRRLPSDGGPKSIPVFEDDAKDAYGGVVGSDPRPIVSEADLVDLGLRSARG